MTLPHTNDRTISIFAANIAYAADLDQRTVERHPVTLEQFKTGVDWRQAVERVSVAVQKGS